MNKKEAKKILKDDLELFKEPSRINEGWVFDPKNKEGQSLVITDAGEVMTYAEYIMRSV